MSRSSLAEVELDRERTPDAARVARDNEVNGKAAEHALAREPCTHLGRLDTDRPLISGISRKAAAEKHLTRRAAEELIMRGQQPHLSEGRDTKLSARAADRSPGDVFLDYSALLRQLGHVRVNRLSLAL